MIRFDLGEKSSGESLVGLPIPISLRIILSMLSSVMFFSVSAAAPIPVPSFNRPIRMCSLPT